MNYFKQFFNSKGFKTFINYLFLSIALTVGFYVGRKTANYPPTKVEVVNPYSKPFQGNEISIAVNESSELLLIDRKTGKYQVYSDEIGKSIYKLYMVKIYNESHE